MKVIIAKIAKNEFKEAKQYYEIQQEGLGKRFNENIKEAIKRINIHDQRQLVTPEHENGVSL